MLPAALAPSGGHDPTRLPGVVQGLELLPPGTEDGLPPDPGEEEHPCSVGVRPIFGHAPVEGPKEPPELVPGEDAIGGGLGEGPAQQVAWGGLEQLFPSGPRVA